MNMLHKKVLNVCKMRRKCLAKYRKACYTEINSNKRGGNAMMNTNLLTTADVDDLIFQGNSWDRSER